MNAFNYSPLYILYIITLVIFITGVESFTPRGRIAHSSILIGTKLYFFGGKINGTARGNEFYSNEVFYLDVSQEFNTVSPPWTEFVKMPFASAWATVSLIDIHNNDPTVYLFGGITRDPISNEDLFTSNVHTLDIKTSEWDIPSINVNGITPKRRRAIQAVNDGAGNIYIFGGTLDDLLLSSIVEHFNEMLILNTNNLMLSYGSTFNAPNGSNCYSATMLTNGVIVYIGGFQASPIPANINEINLYDTKSDTWSSMIANNTSQVESRGCHSAVLAPDGNIIIYGGFKYMERLYAKVEPDLAILNTLKTPFEWTIPTTSSYIGNVPSLYKHTADLIGNYMIIAFGGILPLDPFKLKPSDFHSKVYVMDIRDYTWVNTFEPLQNPNNPNDNSNINKKIIIIGVMSGIIGITILATIGFIYKCHKNRKERNQISNNQKLATI